MSFKIKIVEVREVKRIESEYGVIGKKEVERESRFYSNDCNEPKTYIQEVYGDRPPKEVVRCVEIDLLQQTVERLDLSAVIRAINDL